MANLSKSLRQLDSKPRSSGGPVSRRDLALWNTVEDGGGGERDFKSLVIPREAFDSDSVASFRDEENDDLSSLNPVANLPTGCHRHPLMGSGSNPAPTPPSSMMHDPWRTISDSHETRRRFQGSRERGEDGNDDSDSNAPLNDDNCAVMREATTREKSAGGNRVFRRHTTYVKSALANQVAKAVERSTRSRSRSSFEVEEAEEAWASGNEYPASLAERRLSQIPSLKVRKLRGNDD